MRRVTDLPLSWKLHGAFGSLVLILLALSAVALETMVANQRTAAAVERTGRVIGQANAALASLVDMETGFRGYLIAGQPEYLEPYEAGKPRFEQEMAALMSATADDPAQQARWQAIERDASAWENGTVEPAIAERRAAGPDAPIPPAVVARIRAGDGKVQFDAVRNTFTEAINAEEATLAERSAEATAANERLRIILAAGSAVGVLLAIALAAALSRDVVRAVDQLARAAGRIAAGDLGQRVGIRRGDEIGQAAAAFDRMADELEDSIRQIELLLAAVGDGIVRVDREGVVTFANPAAARMLGYAAGELVGRPFHDTVHHTRADGAPHPRAACAVLAAIGDGKVHEGTGELYWRRDGTSFDVEFTSAPLREGGRVVGAVVDFRDVSDRLRAEREREHLRAAQAAQAAAEVALRERNDVLATVSHDLKTPITSIRGLSQLLGRRLARGQEPSRDELAAWAARIQDSAARMTRLLDDLLDATRLEAGHELDLRLAPTDLSGLAERLAAELRRQSAAHRIVVAAEEGLVGQWDGSRVERVVANLLANAVKYSPDGGEVEVRVCRERENGHAWAVLSVADHGVGIPEADLPHLFERYFRAHNVADRIPGHGLGLAGARRIVEAHGGTILVASAEGAGSTFTVKLPVDGAGG